MAMHKNLFKGLCHSSSSAERSKPLKKAGYGYFMCYMKAVQLSAETISFGYWRSLGTCLNVFRGTNLLQDKIVTIQIPAETPSHVEFHFIHCELRKTYYC